MLTKVQGVPERKGKNPLSYLANAMDLAQTVGGMAGQLTPKDYANYRVLYLNQQPRFTLPGGPYSL